MRINEWIQKLKLVANLQGIKELQTLLPLFLSGGAFAVYQGLNEEVKKKYLFVKAPLMKAFAADPTSAFEEMKTRRLNPTESVDPPVKNC